ncbi:MAG: hypothetical protein ABIY55_05570 [Kofleriaceae bacterium]
MLAAGCQDSEKPDDDVVAPEPAAQLVPGPEREVQLLAHKAVLGFRAEAGAFRAGYATHDVAVQDGVVELTPYNYTLGGARVTGGKIALETGAIRREDGTLLGGGGAAATNGDGAVEITRGTAVEVLANREDGIQQSWKFASAPEGTGDLTVEVEVMAQRFVTANDSGLHFQSPQGLGFRYSHATWLDAAGHEWPIQAAWNDGRISITVPSGVLEDTTFPAVLDPTITAEVAVDTQVNGSTGENSAFPAIAFDGTNYLVVWADQRLSRDEDIFATRVSAAGAILSAIGIPINTAAGRQLNPAVVFAGNQFIVAWEDFKVANGAEADIGAARVSLTGVVTQLGHAASSAQNELAPKLASVGNNALLVWNNGTDVRASLFNGTTFGGAISITADSAVQLTPTVAANPAGNYLIAYSEGPTATADLKGAFVTQAGVKVGAALTLSAGAGRQFEPAASWDGTHYVITWSNNNVGQSIFGARISTAGVVLDTRNEGITPNVGGVLLSALNGGQQRSSVACISGACLLAWQELLPNSTTSFDVYARRLDVATALAGNGADFVVSNGNRGQFLPAVAASATDYFVVWHDGRDVNTNTVFGSRVTAAGVVTDANGLMLVTGNNEENTPAMGRAGTQFGVFWTDSRNFGVDVEMTRFNGGSKLDTTARPVSNATFSQASPSVTMSAGNYFAVWNDSRNGVDRDIFGARITSAGVVLDAAGLPIVVAAADQLAPQITTNGTVSLVVWSDRRAGNFDIRGAIVDNASGAVTVPDFVICDATGDQNRPSVAFDSVTGQFVAVWTDERTPTATVFGARVTTAGVVSDPNGVAISNGANGQFKPRISFALGTGLVVWDDRQLDTQGDIFGARVKPGAALTVLDPAGFSISGGASGGQTEPSVAALGGSFLVAWTDGRNVNTTGTDIFAQQVAVNGQLNGAAFAISTGLDNEGLPTVSDSTTNNTRIAYTRVRTDLQTTRVVTRVVTVSSGTGQACSNNGQCSTGFCVDSKCCDTACGGNNKNDCQGCSKSITGGVDGTCTLRPSGLCRVEANAFCDLREFCTGASPDCPPDVGRNAGLVCNMTTGAVCPASGAPGPHGCP